MCSTHVHLGFLGSVFLPPPNNMLAGESAKIDDTLGIQCIPGMGNRSTASLTWIKHLLKNDELI